MRTTRKGREEIIKKKQRIGKAIRYDIHGRPNFSKYLVCTFKKVRQQRFGFDGIHVWILTN